ncbi:MAG: hypothetical protein RI897_3507 [Verrucomicrobiota bacterium]
MGYRSRRCFEHKAPAALFAGDGREERGERGGILMNIPYIDGEAIAGG